MGADMTFKDFAKINRTRSSAPDGFDHDLQSWSTSDWFTATLGELGEAANYAKKLNRIRDGIPGNGGAEESDLRQKMADEIADTFIYLDLLCQHEGLEMDEIVKAKFDRTSAKIGYPIRLRG